MESPRIWLLAGPNGAGKTTFARESFPELIKQARFLNADDIARKLSPGDQQRSAISAARLALKRRKTLTSRAESFAIETTLASRTLLRMLSGLTKTGYEIRLIYLYISNPNLCIQRVAQRVALGGHHIPMDVILRRYELSLKLLPRYLDVADTAEIYLADGLPRTILRKDRRKTRIIDRAAWKAILAASDQKD